MKLRRINNKKKGTLDSFFVLVEIFGFAIFLLIMYKIWDEFTSADMNEAIWDKTTHGAIIKSNTQVAITNMDWMFMMAYFGLHIGAIVLAYSLRSHPVVLVAGIFLAAILVMISAPLSNTWEDITAEDAFTTPAANMVKTNFIMDKLPIFEVIWFFITLIAFTAFSRSEEWG